MHVQTKLDPPSILPTDGNVEEGPLADLLVRVARLALAAPLLHHVVKLLPVLRSNQHEEEKEEEEEGEKKPCFVLRQLRRGSLLHHLFRPSRVLGRLGAARSASDCDSP